MGLGISTAVARRLSRVFLDPRHDVDRARLIIGSGRSGTTWLQELACRAGSLRPVFEPFHAVREPTFSDVPFGRYIRPETVDLGLRRRVEDVLSGRFRSEWQDHLSRPAVYRGRVVKEIRNLLWSGWLTRNFPQVPTVYVIRHPLAVASSARALEWRPEHFERMAGQSELFEDHLQHVGATAGELRTNWQRALAAWCVENIVAFRTLSGTGAQLLIYEEAMSQPDILRGFLEHFAVPVDGQDGGILPSMTTRRDSPLRSGDRSATSWVASTDRALLAEGMDVLRMFRFHEFFAVDGAVNFSQLRSKWDAPGGRTW
jgi:hypothetical protein